MFSLKGLFTTFCALFLLVANSISATFVTIRIFKKIVVRHDGSKTFRYRIFLGDAHTDYEDGSLKYNQQNALMIWLHYILRANKTAVVAVEEMDNYTGSHPQVRANVDFMVNNDRSIEKQVKKMGTDKNKQQAGHSKTSMDGITDLFKSKGIPITNAEFRHSTMGCSDKKAILADTTAALKPCLDLQNKRPFLPHSMYTKIMNHYSAIRKICTQSTDIPLTHTESALIHDKQRFLLDAVMYYLIDQHTHYNYGVYCFGEAHIARRYGGQGLIEFMKSQGYEQIHAIPYPFIMSVLHSAVDITKELTPHLPQEAAVHGHMPQYDTTWWQKLVLFVKKSLTLNPKNN